METPQHRPLTATERRNHVLMLFYSSSNRVSFNLLTPSLVLAVLVRALGGSDFLVGVLTNLRLLSNFVWPLLVSAYLVRHAGRKYILAGIQTGKAVIYLVLALLIVLVGNSHPGYVLGALFVILSIDAILKMASQVVRLDLLGQLFPEWGQTLFFANDQLLAGIFGIVIGFVISAVLRHDASNHVPLVRYAYLIYIAIGALLVSLAGVALVREPSGALSQRGKVSVREQLRSGWQIFRRNRNYRYFLLTRVSLPLYHIASPFYIVFATEVLHVPPMMVGYYITIQVGSNLLTNFLWRWIDQHWGTQWVMKSAMSVTMVAPLLAIGLPPLMAHAQWSQIVVNWAFGLVYFTFGGAMSGRIIAIQGLLLQVSREEPELRPTYIAFANTMQAFFGISALWGGLVVHYLGYDAVFAMAILFAFWGVYNVYHIHLSPLATKVSTA